MKKVYKMGIIKLFFWSTFCQIFILNNIYLSGYINPYYYIIFIFLMPSKSNKLFLLLLSLILGLTIDIFSQTHGAHACACLLICYIKFAFGGKKEENEESINISKIPIIDFIRFILPLTILHHFTLFFLERFSIGEIIPVIVLTISSTFFTVLLLIIHKILMPKK